MPEIQEKWEEAFEEYCGTLTSLGATIKNKKALKLAYKIYRENIPERIYKNCIDESQAQQQEKKSEVSVPKKEEKNLKRKKKPNLLTAWML